MQWLYPKIYKPDSMKLHVRICNEHSVNIINKIKLAKYLGCSLISLIVFYCIKVKASGLSPTDIPFVSHNLGLDRVTV